MTELLRRAFGTIDVSCHEITSLWQRLVSINSSSSDKPGVDAVSRIAEEELQSLGFTVSAVDYEKAGRLLIADFGDPSLPPVLLLGHLDTVFAAGTAAERPFTVDSDRVTGPGVLEYERRRHRDAVGSQGAVLSRLEGTSPRSSCRR